MFEKAKKYIVLLFFSCFIIVAEESNQAEGKSKLTPDMVVPLLRNDDFFKELIEFYETHRVARKSYRELLLKHFEDFKKNKSRNSIERIPEKVRLKKVEPQKKYGKGSNFGYEYHLPWKLKKKEVWQSINRYSFENGNLVVFYDPENNHIKKTLLNNEVYKTFIDRFVSKGKEETQYDLWVKALNTTSKSFEFNGQETTEEITGLLVLLIIKNIVGMDSSVIYQFDLGEIKGFQFGKPGKDKWIYYHLFDKQNRFIEIFVANRGNKAIIPQKDLNELILSLKKISKK